MSPMWLAQRHQDIFYVAYGWAHCVRVLNAEGEFLYDINTTGLGKLHRPTGLPVDKFNNLIVCDGLNVEVFTLEGKFVNLIKGQPAKLLHPLGFISNIGKHCVYVFE